MSSFALFLCDVPYDTLSPSDAASIEAIELLLGIISERRQVAFSIVNDILADENMTTP